MLVSQFQFALLLFNLQPCSFEMLRSSMPCSDLCTLIVAYTYLCISSCKVLNGENIITSATTYFTSYFFSQLNFICLVRPRAKHTVNS